ncbi:MAG: hypothetical protein MUC72_11785 [Acidobacteria bacterium]|jgi:hypothetical protein|nr:hypothetical protein [Acidobacteriota bacterium]
MKEKRTRTGQAPKKTEKTRRPRVVNVAHGFQQAREWEILQEIAMTPGQRQRAAKALKERFFGRDAPDVREAHIRQ